MELHTVKFDFRDVRATVGTATFALVGAIANPARAADESLTPSPRPCASLLRCAARRDEAHATHSV
jgi:hypothetical protein